MTVLKQKGGDARISISILTIPGEFLLANIFSPVGAVDDLASLSRKMTIEELELFFSCASTEFSQLYSLQDYISFSLP